MTYPRLSLLPSVCVALLVVLGLSTATLHADEGDLILETHVGARPHDADWLLGPLLDGLSKAGYRGSSVAATRITSEHSKSSKELSAKELEEARRFIKEGSNAYHNARYRGAIESSARGRAILENRPATMVKQAVVRELLDEALETTAIASSRLGDQATLDEALAEHIRSFPNKPITDRRYGPELVELYRAMKKTMDKSKKGKLSIVAKSSAMVFVNEEHMGIGSQTLELYPGRYRVFSQSGEVSGRVHIVKVEADREHTLSIDPVVDQVLKTEAGWVGLVFPDEAARAEQEKKVVLGLGRALQSKSIILVGFQEIKGQDSIIAAEISIETGDFGASARVPIPANGAPSPAQLRDLAEFVAGDGPASDDIEVLSAEALAATRKRAAASSSSSSSSQPLRLQGQRDDEPSNISPAWRWTAWGTGALAIGAGAYLLYIDGDPSCTKQVGQLECPEVYKTQGGGIAALAAGALLGVGGFYLWSLEGDDEATQLSVMPTEGGIHAAISGRF